MESSMLAKIISALALTLLLTGGASAFIPQPQEVQTGLFMAELAQQEQGLPTELFAAEPAQQEQSLQTEQIAVEAHNIYAGHSSSTEPQDNLETELFAGDTTPSDPQPHDIYAGHSNSAQAQESLEAQLFAADTVLSESEPRPFD